ncbi:MAG: hypothetical protein A3I11_06660 [Elusimicrobia bacterium RIFCSPLOWO2_02_FULL_39_32]|nr:MAG: hypothetical protein A2034_03270 [Elusimicrobia bacterium GWA2_38_7]OGR81245.1 MAG: hypothetical protein A3B80_09270 [Elusimicrobia bacterium RIFCSPHIGHO2_02_FULL_39_36]OGR91797.1 MAG: hypothetical protein A3I11_06660 [Elusimicrobia bacterium RIFCSPLOWO2_02_FULL_39_32]OGR98456.1 MAG: hypothetical protein A3G85_02520 [Elusimicrobia bacterium RIFCSPLOWO2_12_FULL_39_28]
MLEIIFIIFTFLGSPSGICFGQTTDPAPLLVLLDKNEIPVFDDDADLDSLKNALLQSLNYYAGLPKETNFNFGKDVYSLQSLTDSLKFLENYLEQSPSKEEFSRFIRDHFLIYRSCGMGSKGLVTFSAYYEYTLSASLKEDSIYKVPLYARPPDLLDVYLENFDPSKRGERIVGRADGKNLIPYYTRQEIDSFKILENKNLEIAWAKDPLDILFLQIQGSGWLEIKDSTETFHIRYAGDNGRKFKSVGLYLIESGQILKKDFSRKKMVDVLSQLPEEKRQEVLNQNPRYVFFEVTSPTTPTRGSLLVYLTPGRSIASDPKVFPQGALAWFNTEKSVFDKKGKIIGKKPLKRFVLNQDEGGAIKGAGRIDFFVGRGQEAQKMAESFWSEGDLYFFIKKPSP